MLFGDFIFDLFEKNLNSGCRHCILAERKTILRRLFIHGSMIVSYLCIQYYFHLFLKISILILLIKFLFNMYSDFILPESARYAHCVVAAAVAMRTATTTANPMTAATTVAAATAAVTTVTKAPSQPPMLTLVPMLILVTMLALVPLLALVPTIGLLRFLAKLPVLSLTNLFRVSPDVLSHSRKLRSQSWKLFSQ